LKQIDTLTLKINELKQKVSQLSEEAKTSVEDNFKKLLGLLSNLETAKQRIAKIIKAKKISHPESADQQNNSGTNPIESAISTADELNDSVSESVTHTLDNIWDGLNKLRDRIASLELNKFE
jgi:methyl-accepting chemotaxis protein